MGALSVMRNPRGIVSDRAELRAVPHPRRAVPRAFTACHSQPSSPEAGTQTLSQRILSGACAAALATAVSLAPMDAVTLSAHAQPVSNDTPVLDLARVVPAGKMDELQARLQKLERDKGYRVRVLTRYGPSAEPSLEQLRKGWAPDESTVVVLVDPTASSIISFQYGMDVQKVLRRPFFTELQSRFGNLFYVREQGESRAVLNALDVLLTSLEHPEECLAQGGCRQVPGVSSDMYFFTLGTSIAGGLVVGFVNKLEPQGWVQRKWVWQLLFAPLWASLFINFGLGPILTRTSDPLPVLGNVAGFAGAAALVIFSPALARASGLMRSGSEGDK